MLGPLLSPLRNNRRSLCCALLLGTLAVWLSACSTTGFFYNRLDSLIPWYLGRYVNLNTEQRAVLDEELAELLRWHRQQELPLYVPLLDTTLSALEAPVTPAVVADLSEQTEAAWLRLRDRALPALLRLGDTLDEAQVESLLSKLDEKQLELEQEYLPRTDAEYREEARESMRRGVKRYLGRLSAGQEALLEQASEALLRVDRGWLAQRERGVAALSSHLRARQPGWQQAFQQTLDDWWQAAPEDYSEAYAHNAQQVRAAMAAVVDLRDARQDQRLRRKLGNLRGELAALVPAVGTALVQALVQR